MLFEEVMVSTDDEEIARVAKTFGAVVPFMRSKETSNDFSTTAEVMIEVLKDYKQKGCEFDMACCIYPTASLMTSARLKKAYELLVNSDASSLIPITKFSSSIWRSFKIEDNKIGFIWPENALKRTQDLPAAYHGLDTRKSEQQSYFRTNWFNAKQGCLWRKYREPVFCKIRKATYSHKCTIYPRGLRVRKINLHPFYTVKNY